MIKPITSDLPRPTDFVAPYFFFANREESQVTYASPSVASVLGFDPQQVLGLSYHEFLLEDPLNDDVLECEQQKLSDGESIHALRCVRDASGRRRILYVQTIGASDYEGGPVTARHNIAHDVTESVEAHRNRMTRLKELDFAVKQLSSQEREVAEKIMEGKMNREIARELNVSNRTVERRRAAVLKHLNVATTWEMVSKMVERDMLMSWATSASDNQWQRARNAHLVMETTAPAPQFAV
ncbi:MAG: LuxR C-terminal-related transcriptional regulator [Planctomycetota bacterium]